MKVVHVKDGLIHLSESKAFCPFCERFIPWDETGEKLKESPKWYIRHKCKCKRFIAITSDIKGDLRAFKLSDLK